MGMTMAQILKRTPRSRQLKADYVRIEAVKIRKTTYKTVVYKAKTRSTANSEGKAKRGGPVYYVTTVETNGKMCVVGCSCEDFTFTWEVALNKKKAARIEYSNGDLPVDRNPRMIPGCCGHLFRFGTLLVERGKVE
jgi:hypothetical protein